MADGDRDRIILKQVAEGDIDCFAELVDRHQRRLIALCHRFLGDREEAREVAQDVFFEVYRQAKRFQPRAKVSTWIHRIAVNRCLNRLRRHKIVRFFSFDSVSKEGDEGHGDLPLDRLHPRDPAPDPEIQLQTRQRWAKTRSAIDRLPPSQKAVLVLAKFEGMSYREIADTLAISVSAVESRLFRAMQRLMKAQEKDR